MFLTQENPDPTSEQKKKVTMQASHKDAGY